MCDGTEGQDRESYTDDQDRESYEPDPDWIDRHSAGCYFCGQLVDERDCIPADAYNNNDGGDICPKCLDKIDPVKEP